MDGLIERMRDVPGHDVLRAIGAQDAAALGVPAGTPMVVAPRGLWTFGVVDDGHLVGLGVCRRETFWFAWRDGSIDQLRPHKVAIEKRARGGRWIDDVRMFIYDIHREVDRGPWLRFVRGPAPFDDAAIGTSLALGRNIASDLVVHDPLLSRRHCIIGITEGYRWQIADNTSTSGTYLNGQLVGEATAIADRDRIRIGRTEMEVMFDYRPHPRDPDGWRDDDRWRALFLESILFPSCVPRGDPASAAADDLFAKLGGLRAGAVEWQRDAFRAIDTRWLFASRDDAEVFFDAVLERGTAGFEPEVAPVIGDACARTGRREAHSQLIRAGRVVAQLWNQGDFHHRTLDDMAARVVTRIIASGF